jgi:hypothetical protein
MSQSPAPTRNVRNVPPRNTSDAMRPADDIVSYLKTYAREKPDVAALWCFGIGFVLGWKLKPW